MAIKAWVRLPTAWIEAGGLKNLKWERGGGGSNNAAALMALTVISHAADPETGIARATYDDICKWTGLSRAKLSNGLVALTKNGIIAREADSLRSTYKLVGYSTLGGWAMLPAKSMYGFERIMAFDHFQLRRAAELDALKLFFLLVARRDRANNRANISYDKICEYTGIPRARLRTAISFLASLSLIYIEHVPSRSDPKRIASAYRIVGIDPFNHMGTRGRAEELTPPTDAGPAPDYSEHL
jgi:hypothetical protein